MSTRARAGHAWRAAAIALALVLVAPHVEAQKTSSVKTPDARRHLDRGLALFEAHDYDHAAEEFRQGYAVEPAPDFLYALAQAERLGGDCAAAREAYRAFLETRPPRDEAALAEENLAKCASASSPPPAPSPASAPAPAPASPSAPSPSSPPATSPQPDHLASSSRRFYEDVPGDVLGATGIAALGAGLGLALAGNAQASSSASATTYDDVQRDGDHARTLRWVAVACAGAGAALLVLSIVRYATR